MPNLMVEAEIIINGIKLSFAESLTIRVALESYAQDIHHLKLLDEDKDEKGIFHSYLRCIDNIRIYSRKNVGG